MGCFVVPDLHGNQYLLDKMLEKWNPDTQLFVQLGDILDRGKQSYGVIKRLMELNKKYGIKVTKGNHEEMFLNFLDEPQLEGEFYFDSGGRATVDSFFGKETAYRKTPVYIADYIKNHFPKEVDFIRNLPLYAGWKDWVFSHAGVNFDLDDWRETFEGDFTGMTYERFAYIKNNYPFKFVAGHTHTNKINSNKSNDVWVSDCGTKFLLDGDVIDGQLNALVIHDDNSYQIEVVK